MVLRKVCKRSGSRILFGNCEGQKEIVLALSGLCLTTPPNQMDVQWDINGYHIASSAKGSRHNEASTNWLSVGDPLVSRLGSIAHRNHQPESDH